MKSLPMLSRAIGLVSIFTLQGVAAIPIDIDMTSGTWIVTAFDTAGNNWSGSTLNFESQVASGDDWLLSGYFYWNNETGTSYGRENFAGTLSYDRSLYLEGHELVAPISNIIMGEYFAELSVSDAEIINGTWQSGVPYVPTDGWTAARMVVPVPAAVWLLGSGLLGLVGVAKRTAS
ncbi:VPLPA-CTERM sorting domain-containing protein [Aquamicrobium sp.]|uniref:VPLPA-CTERM sorting domain-containing protein n=1 Tax=Aquamicrobium sp. TaxID=1872579 RepID=UPI00258D4D82|nr:VPLPA-CTERM sorting domain-containing protein [Aquamicrobium sp.]MCK9553748.1 VPLPA-CTERM sorting domain-containing protein [Aquamicrobium sp.]